MSSKRKLDSTLSHNSCKKITQLQYNINCTLQPNKTFESIAKDTTKHFMN